MSGDNAPAESRDFGLITEVAEAVAVEQPIGSFQVIQHMLVDMLLAVDGVDLLTREAFWRMAQGLPAKPRHLLSQVFSIPQWHRNYELEDLLSLPPSLYRFRRYRGLQMKNR